MARLRKAATIRRAKVRNRRYSITQEWRDIHHEHDITVSSRKKKADFKQ